MIIVWLGWAHGWAGDELASLPSVVKVAVDAVRAEHALAERHGPFGAADQVGL